RASVDRQGSDAHTPPRDRRRGDRQPYLRSRRRHTAGVRGQRRERRVRALSRRGRARLALLALLGASAASPVLGAGPTREEALEALADTGNVDHRRLGVLALAETALAGGPPALP